MLLHVEPVEDPYNEIKTKALAAMPVGWEEDAMMSLAADHAALQGMVPWEAGNARYLQETVGAKLVTPETLLSRSLGKTEEKFPVNWKVLLKLRGFGPEVISFVESCECSLSLHVRPLENISSMRCETSLERFVSGPLIQRPWSQWLLESSTVPCDEGITIVRPSEILGSWTLPECEGTELPQCGDLLAWRLPKLSMQQVSQSSESLKVRKEPELFCPFLPYLELQTSAFLILVDCCQ